MEHEQEPSAPNAFAPPSHAPAVHLPAVDASRRIWPDVNGAAAMSHVVGVHEAAPPPLKQRHHELPLLNAAAGGGCFHGAVGGGGGGTAGSGGGATAVVTFNCECGVSKSFNADGLTRDVRGVPPDSPFPYPSHGSSRYRRVKEPRPSDDQQHHDPHFHNNNHHHHHHRGFIRKISDSFISSFSDKSRSSSSSSGAPSSVFRRDEKTRRMLNCCKLAGIVTAVLILLGAAIVAGYFTLWCFVGKGHEPASVSSSSPSTNAPPTSGVTFTTPIHSPLPPASNRSIFCHKYKAVPKSCPQRRWRSVDASCNNIDNPLWGSSFTALRRLLPSRYENKIDAPVGWDRSLRYSGFPLPSTRDVSIGVVGAKTVRLDASVNPFLMSFGQYISHDTDLTRHMRQVNPGLTWFPHRACKDDCTQRVPCFPIPISGSDPRSRSGQRCVEFIRSVAMCDPYPVNKKKNKSNLWTRRRTEKTMNATKEEKEEEDDDDDENKIEEMSNEAAPETGKREKRSSYAESHSVPMEQANEVTSLIDASTVYGSTAAAASKLRGANGTLKVSSQELFLKGLLPFQPTSMGCTPLFGKEIKRLVDVPCFAAGDGRVNEHLGLIVIHSLFHREHNRIVEELRRVNPHWDGDRLFEEARNINAAIHQHVTFNEYLPQVLGPIGMKMIGRYHGYNPLVDPSVSSEFSTAAFRFGHAQIHPIQFRLDENYKEIPQGHLPIRLTFFSPYRVTEEGGLDPLLRGLIGTPGKEVANDSPLAESVIEELWVLTEKHALDLGALNTQRGRDHALRSYLDYRRYCLLSAPTTWSSFASIMRRDIAIKLEELYGSPENIDLWVGALLEERLPGADVGPTFTCMLVEGFRRVRDGDRFWYELPTVLTSAQTREIKKTSLARIVCDNSDGIDRVPTNIFLMTHPDKMTKCPAISGIDFFKWREEVEEDQAGDMRMTTPERPEEFSTSTTATKPSTTTTMPTPKPSTLPTTKPSSKPTTKPSTTTMPTTMMSTTSPEPTTSTAFSFSFIPKDDPNLTEPTSTGEDPSSSSSSSSSSSTQPQDLQELFKEIEMVNPFANQGDDSDS